MSKTEKIKAEIDRRIKEICDSTTGYIMDSRTSAEIRLLYEFASFIDSLSDTEKDFGIKESVIPFGASDSELMEATYFIPQGYHAVIEGNKVIIKKGEEPVSNDLEEAAHSYVDTTIEHFDSEGNPCCYPAFIAGAQWQKKQLIDKAIKWLEDNIDRYLYNTGGYGEYIPKCGGKMFEDFKKAVEE